MPANILSRCGVCALLVLALLAGGGCQSHPAAQRGAYRVVWSTYRAKDNSPLEAYRSPVFGVNGSVDLHTDSKEPGGDRPAFPRFTATLSPDRLRANTLELVTRAYVREEIHTKKGKRKVTRRVIGGLLPIHAGETQELQGPGDAIRVTVLLLGGGGVQSGK